MLASQMSRHNPGAPRRARGGRQVRTADYHSYGLCASDISARNPPPPVGRAFVAESAARNRRSTATGAAAAFPPSEAIRVFAGIAHTLHIPRRLRGPLPQCPYPLSESLMLRPSASRTATQSAAQCDRRPQRKQPPAPGGPRTPVSIRTRVTARSRRNNAYE